MLLRHSAGSRTLLPVTDDNIKTSGVAVDDSWAISPMGTSLGEFNGHFAPWFQRDKILEHVVELHSALEQVSSLRSPLQRTVILILKERVSQCKAGPLFFCSFHVPPLKDYRP